MATNSIDFTIYFRNATQVAEQVRNFRNEVRQANEAIKDARKVIKEENDELKRLDKALKAGSIAQDKYDREVKQANKSISEQNKIIAQNTKVINQNEKQIGKLNLALKVKNQFLNNAIFMLTRYAGAFALLGIVKNVTGTIIQFEKAMKQVQAISGATADEMERLTQVALTAGKIYTPKEVAELELILSKLGFTAAEIGASTEAIVNLSIATGEDLATSAELAASIVRGFNLEISQTAKVTETLAAGLNSSALSLSNTREAIKYVAPIAAQLGWTFEDVTAALGKLSNAQISGSLAGTSLRNIMAELADKGSKLSQVLGQPKTFDEFIDGLNNINKAGVNLDNIFKLVPKRATSALAILIANSDVLKQYRNELDATSGAIQNMVDIQMQSLANQTKALNSRWQAFLSSVDEGDGVFSRAGKWFVKLADDAVFLATALNELGIMATIGEMHEYRLALEQAAEDERVLAESINKKNEEYLKSLKLRAEQLNQPYNKVITDEIASVTEQIRVMKNQNVYLSLQKNILSPLSIEWQNLTYEMAKNENQIKLGNRALGLLSKEIEKTGIDLGGDTDGSKRLSLLREQMKMAVDLLKAQMELEEQRIKATTEGAEEELLLAKNTRDFKNKISLEELKWNELIAKEQGQSIQYIADLKKKTYLEMRADDMEYFGAFVKLNEDSEKKLDEIWNKIFKEDLKKFKLQLRTEFSKVTPEELAGEGSIFERLMGDPDKIRELINTLYSTADLITDAFKDIADAQVDAIDRIVDRYDQMVEETQRQLEIETELFAAGYASNVTLKQQELDQLKAQRDVALKDQQEYVKMQQRLESTVQAINLASAVAGILKNLSVTNPFALIAAPGVIAALFKLWNDAKVRAIESSYQFGEGGWIDGQPHSKGGKWINAEGGEFVVNKQSSGKFAPLLEAINTGRKIPLDLMLDRNLIKDLDRKQHGLEMMQHRVTFDDGKAYKELKTIRELLSDKGGTEYRNGYRIERTGIRTRKIYDN